MNKEIDDIEKALFVKEDIEQQWLDEAERRLLDYRSGKTTARPAEEVFSEIKQQFI